MLYAGTNGYTDIYPGVGDSPVRDGDARLYGEGARDILSAVRDKKAIDEGLEADLNKALTQFKELFI